MGSRIILAGKTSQCDAKVPEPVGQPDPAGAAAESGRGAVHIPLQNGAWHKLSGRRHAPSRRTNALAAGMRLPLPEGVRLRPVRLKSAVHALLAQEPGDPTAQMDSHCWYPHRRTPGLRGSTVQRRTWGSWRPPPTKYS